LGTWGDVGTFSFDFAKTMTTGEGGMLVFRDKKIWEKAVAWHDHGHENNPAVPRWEDTRTSSGFNYRMMELQGAVGIAQLKKLSTIVAAQRANRDRLWSAIVDLPSIEPRAVPEGAFETADALVFLVPNTLIASRCRQQLLEVGLATKILPEAFTWHFAGTWNHMPELVAAHGGNLHDSFPQSHSIISRAVSLPVGVNMAEDTPLRARQAIEKAIKS
jgi:8-amino-3,8-dideoxy-alpha-D-manno-octulosonate transaminase